MPAPPVHEYGEDKLNGPMKVTYADGAAYVGRCEAGANVGQGVKWSADRTQAWEMREGYTVVRSISLEEAAAIASQIGLPPP